MWRSTEVQPYRGRIIRANSCASREWEAMFTLRDAGRLQTNII